MERREVLREFDPFFEVWYPHLLRYVCRFAASRSEAEDTVQEVFLDLYKALLAGQRIEFPKAWTIRVAQRKCAELRGRPFNLELSHEPVEMLENSGPNPVNGLDSDIDMQRLRGCLSALSNREEQVMLLRLQAMKFKEIAGALGITTSTVNTLLVRGLEKLQQSFGVQPASIPAKKRLP
ncbi:MAG: sigma-70 family RNA polymerase sigma factor [Acidobacteriota bacterium]